MAFKKKLGNFFKGVASVAAPLTSIASSFVPGMGALSNALTNYNAKQNKTVSPVGSSSIVGGIASPVNQSLGAIPVPNNVSDGSGNYGTPNSSISSPANKAVVAVGAVGLTALVTKLLKIW